MEVAGLPYVASGSMMWSEIAWGLHTPACLPGWLSQSTCIMIETLVWSVNVMLQSVTQEYTSFVLPLACIAVWLTSLSNHTAWSWVAALTCAFLLTVACLYQGNRPIWSKILDPKYWAYQISCTAKTEQHSPLQGSCCPVYALCVTTTICWISLGNWHACS